MDDNPVIGCFIVLLLIICVGYVAEKACNDFFGVKQSVQGTETPTPLPRKAYETDGTKDQSAYTKDSTNLRAFVITDNNEGLYMRSEKSLNSSKVVFAPEGSEVTILYYDEQKVSIGGKVGRWCRVRYDGHEGWVWGWDLEVR